MKRSHIVFIGLTGLALLIMFLFDYGPTNTSMNKRNPVIITPQDIQLDKVKRADAAPARNLFSITPDELNKMRETLPSTEKVKEEILANAHRIPPSLLNFAKSMTPLMEKALKDSDDAEILINALGDCALNESLAHSARVLCVTNSERLAINHQQLKTKASKIRSNVDPEVRKILKRQDALKN